MAAAWTVTSFSFLFGADYQDTSINLDIPIDVNGDGRLDLVVARHAAMDQPPVPITVLLNQGNGHFEDATSTFFPGGAPTTIGASQAAVADFNGDGRLDVFIADYGMDMAGTPGAQNHLLLSSGAHSFADATDRLPQLSDVTGHTDAADIDGDGDMDVFVTNFVDFFLRGTPLGDSLRPYFLMNDGTGHFTPDYARLPTAIENAVVGYSPPLFFDANGDHHPDLLLGGNLSDPSVLLLNDGSGDFSNATSIDLPAPSGFSQSDYGVHAAAAADLTGNGHQDLVLVYEHGYPYQTPQPPPGYVQIHVLINDGHGHFTDETAQRLPNSGDLGVTPAIKLLDFNGDGYTDIVPRLNPTPILLNDGTGHFIALPVTFPVNYSWWGTHAPNLGSPDGVFAKTVFDANGDGHMDLVYQMLTRIGPAQGNYVLFTWHNPGLIQTGTAGVDVLLGDIGNDTLSGLGGKDIIFGGGGADRLYGGGVADYLNGGRGIDRISGGPGNDSLFGGPGADRFVFEAPLNALSNVDRILDFAHGLDKVVLSKTYFAGIATAGHPLAASQFHVGAQATTHFQHIIYNPINGFLYYDQDGNRAAHPQVHFATMTTGLALTHFDFLVAA